MMKILLACGGTGGHIFPAFSVADEIKKTYPKATIVYICGKKDIEDAIFRMISGEKVYSVESAPFRGSRSLWSPSFLIKLAGGFFASCDILMKEQPSVVVGFGGHYSFPVIAAAKFFGVKTLIHEQNVVPGMANKVLTRIVDGVALSFPETEKYLPKNQRMCVTGNPIRAHIERDCRQEALDFFGFSEGKVTLLVLGGSQGSESINTVFLESLSRLSTDIKDRLQVVHLCGKMEPGQAEAALKKEGVSARAFSFFERMDMAYGATDFAIGRAGATFLAEMKAKGIPAILVPYPFAGGHQKLNAEAFLSDKHSVIIDQQDLNAERLAESIRVFHGRAIDNRARITAAGSKSGSEITNSRVKLMNLILEISQ